MGLIGKTIIGIKYTFKNSIAGTNSNDGNGETYTLNNQKLTIKYTTMDYYEDSYNSISPQNDGNTLGVSTFSLILKNINGGAVKMDTTPQDFYIDFKGFKLNITDQSQNIVLIWENNSTENYNVVSNGGMSTLGVKYTFT